MHIPGTRLVRITYTARRKWQERMAKLSKQETALREAARRRHRAVGLGKLCSSLQFLSGGHGDDHQAIQIPAQVAVPKTFAELDLLTCDPDDPLLVEWRKKYPRYWRFRYIEVDAEGSPVKPIGRYRWRACPASCRSPRLRRKRRPWREGRR